MDIDIRSLPLIERGAFPDLPAHMECRLLARDGLEPAIVLWHPNAELHVLVRLTDQDRMATHVETLHGAVLKQAMGETPESGEGYRVDA